jgi:hypothetical protein
MNHEQEQLNQAAAIVRRAMLQAGAALSLVTNAHRLDGEALRSTLAEVKQQAEGAFEGGKHGLSLLQSMGATLTGKAAMPAPVPLSKLSTPAGRELLDLLAQAERAAQAVDRERGWIDEDGQGIGYAESLQMMAIQLRRDVEAPKGRD